MPSSSTLPPTTLTEDIQDDRSGEAGCLARSHHTTVVGGSIRDCNIGQGNGVSTWALLPILVPHVGELGCVGTPCNTGQIHQLPLLHGVLGPHLHTHGWGEKDDMKLCKTSHLSA